MRSVIKSSRGCCHDREIRRGVGIGVQSPIVKEERHRKVEWRSGDRL